MVSFCRNSLYSIISLVFLIVGCCFILFYLDVEVLVIFKNLSFKVFFLSITIILFYIFCIYNQEFTLNDSFFLVYFVLLIMLYFHSHVWIKLLISCSLFLLNWYFQNTSLMKYIKKKSITFMYLIPGVTVFFSPMVFLSSCFLILSISLQLTEYYQRILIDNESITYHWLNDRDLIYTNYLLHLLKLMTFLFLILSIINLESELTSELFYLNLLYSSFLINLFITFWANIHIIFWRNPEVTNKLISVCKTCFTTAVGLSFSAACYFDVTSNQAYIAPTKWGNWYQINTPNGRGFAFPSSRIHQQWMSLELLSEFDNANKMKLLDENKMVDEKLVQKFILDNSVSIVGQLSEIDRFNLGVKKNYYTPG